MSTNIPEVLQYVILEQGKKYDPNHLVLEDLFDPRVISQSIYECTRSKMWKSSVSYAKFYSDYLTYEINQEILSEAYELDDLFHTVINERGKERLLSSLTFKDRVIEKILNQGFILPLFRPRLIYDNCASLQDRGIHFALNRLEAMIRKMYIHYGKNFYVAKCDIKSYFDNIPHQYLYQKFIRYTYDSRILLLIEKILNQYMIDPAIHNGEKIPFGIGLGGEVAQSFGILCLDDLDHIMKEHSEYKSECYIRYMDDFIFMDTDKNSLKYKMDFIRYYLNQIGGLYLNENKSFISHINQGVKFLKVHFYINENGQIYKHPDSKSFKREKRKLYKLYDLYINGNNISFDNIYHSYQSWRGYIYSVSDIVNIIGIYDQLYEELFNEDTIIERIINMNNNKN